MTDAEKQLHRAIQEYCLLRFGSQVSFVLVTQHDDHYHVASNFGPLYEVCKTLHDALHDLVPGIPDEEIPLPSPKSFND